ncbi:hypothetical protein BDR04DRAFT_840643 [Suillus decipiens]|nr:hypothetical protein BDR04DRAFT_840643 [Suillus decipiens]
MSRLRFGRQRVDVCYRSQLVRRRGVLWIIVLVCLSLTNIFGRRCQFIRTHLARIRPNDLERLLAEAYFVKVVALRFVRLRVFSITIASKYTPPTLRWSVNSTHRLSSLSTFYFT